MANDSLADRITELEHQTWKVLQDSGDKLLPYLSRDCIMLFPLGMKISHGTSPNIKDVMTSEAFVPWKTYDLRDVEVTPVGLEGAIISYEAKATREGLEEPFRAMISSTWRKDPNSERWLMCFQQQTPFTPMDL